MATNKAGKKIVTVSLTSGDLSDLARYISAGRVMLQTSYPPVVARLKKAMTTMGVSTKGL